MIKQNMSASRNQAGFSFIEIMVSVVILGVGLLGLGSLQVVGVQNNHSAYQRSQATLLSYEIVEAMRANRNGAINGRYDRGYGDGRPDPGGSVANNDLNVWLDNIENSLAGGEGAIAVNASGEVQVQVRWLDDRQSEDEEQQRREFGLRTEI